MPEQTTPRFRLTVEEFEARIDVIEPHPDPEEHWQPQQITDALRAEGVSHGIDLARIASLCDELERNGEPQHDVVVARGTPPIAPGLRWSPAVEPGAVVVAGEVIWRGVPCETGESGTNLQGRLMPYGEARPIELGPGCHFGLDESEIQASTYGRTAGGSKPGVLPMIHISADEMEATADIYPHSTGGRQLTEEDLIRALRSARITYGIIVDDRISQALEKARAGGNPERGLLLARGKRPRSGRAGFKCSFQLDGRDPVDVARDVETGALDPTLLVKPMVRHGWKLASATPESSPRLGINLFGLEVSYEIGARDAFIVPGRNVEKAEDGTTFRATIPGWGYASLSRIDANKWRLDVEDPLLVSSDRTSLDLLVHPPRTGQPPLALADLQEALRAQELGIEVDLEMAQVLIEAVLAGDKPGLVSIAQAIPPEDGADGKLDFLFDTVQQAGMTREDGTMDYYQRSTVFNVKAGEPVGQHVPPTPGQPGVDLWGRPLPARPGQAVDLSGMIGVDLSADGQQLISQLDGCLVFEEGRPGVYNPLVIEGDVDFKTGHILSEHASVEIQGSVADRFQVRSAQGEIRIAGDVEDACIEAPQAGILIGRGVLMKGTGRILAGGEISATYVQNARLLAGGNIRVANSVVNSYLESGEKILMPEAQLMGGIVKSRLGVVTKHLGSDSHIETALVVGITYGELELIATARRRFTEEIEQIARLIGEDTPLERFEMLPPEQFSLFSQIVAWRDRARAGLDKLDEVERRLVELNKQRRQASVVVLGTLFPGVRVNILGRVYEVTHRVSQCAIEYDREKDELLLRPSVVTSVEAEAAGTLEQPVAEIVQAMQQNESEFPLEELLQQAGVFWTSIKRQKYTVLVVDDDHLTRQVLRKMLEAEGYRVLQDAGRNVLEQMRASPVHLVLLDISLQGIDGIEILQQIKSDRELARTPVVMLSARKDKETILRVRRHRADDYIVKPFDRATILDKVAAMKKLGAQHVTEMKSRPRPVENPQVLVVDDDAAIRRILARILASLGCQVVQAANAREAIDALREQRFHLLFLDIGMPVVDGLTLCARIRQIETLKELPIVICSARKEKESILAAREAGATDYVVKPFNKATIQEKLSMHLPSA